MDLMFLLILCFVSEFNCQISRSIERTTLSFKKQKLETSVYDEVILCTKPMEYSIKHIFCSSHVSLIFENIKYKIFKGIYLKAPY